MRWPEDFINKIICGDCLEVIQSMPKDIVDVVLTDPPYPNKANHFNDEVRDAIAFMRVFQCERWFVFWDEMSLPPVPLPLVARHIWYRNNSNRPDNYEAIYEFNVDGQRKPSRTFSFPVIYPGLTGCVEATGHPTQKNVHLLISMINKCKINGVIFDPFLGSGTTAEACKLLHRNFIGIEINPEYCKIAEERLAQGVL